MLLAKTTHYGSSFTFFLVRPDLPQMLKCLNSFLTSGIYFFKFETREGVQNECNPELFSPIYEIGWKSRTPDCLLFYLKRTWASAFFTSHIRMESSPVHCHFVFRSQATSIHAVPSLHFTRLRETPGPEQGLEFCFSHCGVQRTKGPPWMGHLLVMLLTPPAKAAIDLQGWGFQNVTVPV